MAKCLVFDVYGTLLDIGSPVASLAKEIGPDAARLSDLWRAKQLEYAWVATLTRHDESFWTLTERALDHAMEAIGLRPAPGLRDALLDAYHAPAVYSEVSDALAKLRERGHRLAVLSNAGKDMLEAALRVGGIIDAFDDVLSVESVQRFKPDLEAYRFGADRLQLKKSGIRFLSSNSWDVAGASRFGWRSFWVNRKGMTFEYAPSPKTATLGSLADLPGALAKH